STSAYPSSAGSDVLVVSGAGITSVTLAQPIGPATHFNTTVDSGGGTLVTMGAGAYVFSGATSSGVAVTSGAVLEILSGGTAVATAVSSGGIQQVDAGGVASGTVVSTGGLDTIYGSESQATIKGAATIGAGGKAHHLTVSSGGTLNVLGTVTSNTTVSAGSVENVFSGGLISGATGSGTVDL